jgi:hypothetical protein
MKQEGRHVHAAPISTDEVMGASAEWQVVATNAQHERMRMGWTTRLFDADRSCGKLAAEPGK